MIRAIEITINCYLNVLDLAITFLLCASITEKRIRLTMKWLVLWIIFGSAMGIIGEVVTVPYLFEMLSFFLFISVAYVVYQEKKIYRIIIMYAISFFFIMLFKVPMIFMLTPISFLSEYLFATIAQTISFILILTFVKKIPLYRLLNEMERRLVLRWFFFGVLGVFVIIFVLLNYDHENIITYIPFLLILVVISFACLYKTTKQVIFYVDKMPAISHEIINMLFSLQILSYISSDRNVFRNEIARYYKSFGFGELTNDMKQEDTENNIRSLIDLKIKKSKKDLTVDTDIAFLGINEKVSTGNIINMLGILLDNAIDASKSAQHPILVKLLVIDHTLTMRVANECDDESAKKLKKAFEKNYISRAKDSHLHGRGLPNLLNIIKECDAKFIFETEYKTEYNCNYVTAVIESNEYKYRINQ